MHPPQLVCGAALEQVTVGMHVCRLCLAAALGIKTIHWQSIRLTATLAIQHTVMLALILLQAVLPAVPAALPL